VNETINNEGDSQRKTKLDREVVLEQAAEVRAKEREEASKVRELARQAAAKAREEQRLFTLHTLCAQIASAPTILTELNQQPTVTPESTKTQNGNKPGGGK
jgi:hypothetical protein